MLGGFLGGLLKGQRASIILEPSCTARVTNQPLVSELAGGCVKRRQPTAQSREDLPAYYRHRQIAYTIGRANLHVSAVNPLWREFCTLSCYAFRGGAWDTLEPGESTA